MQDLVEHLSILLAEKGWKIVAAESCTGGLLAAAITHRPGSSQIFERGFVTYSNEAKMECLGVSAETLEKYGAVSDQTAEEMALGALKHSKADLAISITGIAGPDGGSHNKPVGLVYFGYALKGGSSGSLHENYRGNREQIRGKAAAMALKSMISVLETET
ncbi:MAG: damage-inducible protein CinA [Micavibrio sp.]|nr:damage-inducible protein CinA [Micavibrio sp.]|tara:strand:+ start:2210 stop:2692 length:483 start_codon:yes stop_codon:yes gene_type:complete